MAVSCGFAAGLLAARWPGTHLLGAAVPAGPGCMTGGLTRDDAARPGCTAETWAAPVPRALRRIAGSLPAATGNHVSDSSFPGRHAGPVNTTCSSVTPSNRAPSSLQLSNRTREILPATHRREDSSQPVNSTESMRVPVMLARPARSARILPDSSLAFSRSRAHRLASPNSNPETRPRSALSEDTGSRSTSSSKTGRSALVRRIVIWPMAGTLASGDQAIPVRGDRRRSRRHAGRAGCRSCGPDGEERPRSGRLRGNHTHAFPGLERSSSCSITAGTMP